MSGPECCSNPPTLNPTAGAGHVDQFGALNAYITGSPNSNSAVLLISDVFAKVVTELAKSGLVQAAVLLHPSFVSVDDIKVSHGWTVRYNPDDAEAVKAADEAHQDLLDWSAKHLK
ncbi:hypothetical protein TSUD_196450 [Trifolium subterraneum]|nr:hypothetical protein TSUD_196450 [Trifolium subterraneum]